MSEIRISTQHNGTHKDFYVYDERFGESSNTDLELLEEYLDTFDYYESGTLIGEVLRAMEDERGYIVEPVNGDEDLTIDFSYS